jgi:hypothetical protein
MQQTTGMTFHRIGNVLPARTDRGRWAVRAIVSDRFASHFEQAFHFWTKAEAIAFRAARIA